MILVNKILLEKNSLVTLHAFDNKSRRLIYQLGTCSLKEMMDYKLENNIKWNIKDIMFIA